MSTVYSMNYQCVNFKVVLPLVYIYMILDRESWSLIWLHWCGNTVLLHVSTTLIIMFSVIVGSWKIKLELLILNCIAFWNTRKFSIWVLWTELYFLYLKPFHQSTEIQKLPIKFFSEKHTKKHWLLCC